MIEKETVEFFPTQNNEKLWITQAILFQVHINFFQYFGREKPWLVPVLSKAVRHCNGGFKCSDWLIYTELKH